MSVRFGKPEAGLWCVVYYRSQGFPAPKAERCSGDTATAAILWDSISWCRWKKLAFLAVRTGSYTGGKNDCCFLSLRREDQFCVAASQDCPLGSGEENRSSSSTPLSRGWRWGSRYSCSVLPWGSQPLATSGTGMGTCWNTRRKKNSG